MDFFGQVRHIREAMEAGYTNQHFQQSGTQIIEAYSAEIQQRYLSASAGDGTWLPLAASTIRRRQLKEAPQQAVKRWDKQAQKLGPGKMSLQTRVQMALGNQFPVLYDTGKLYGSLKPGGANNIMAWAPDRMRYGSDVFYAVHHQSPSIEGRPPERTILVEPSEKTMSVAHALLIQAFNKIASGQ